MIPVALERVDEELSVLWENEATELPRMTLMTLVALVSDPAFFDRASRALATAAQNHPARTIAALWHPGDQGVVTARIALHRESSGKACGDDIVLEAFGNARAWLPGNIDRLLLPDLPVFVWWVGDLPDADDLFDQMIRSADVVVVDSGDMDLRDLEKLSRLVRTFGERFALMDMAWMRLRAVQDLVARFFDDPTVRPWLDDLASVTVRYSPRPNDTDATCTQAGLFVGWLAAALGFRTDTVQWRLDAQAHESEANVLWGQSGKTLTVRFAATRRPSVEAGCILGVELVSRGARGEARFEVARQTDPLTCVWRCAAPGCVVPPQVLRVGLHVEATLLTRYLERPERDRLFEASLHAGSALVKAIAPRLSSPPPPPR